MKAVVLSLLFLAISLAPAAADNALQNGDFADGLAHWEGDCAAPSVADADAPSTGAVIHLRNEWTKMTQIFNASRGHYVISITFSLLPGTTFNKGGDGTYRKIPKKLGYTALSEFNLKPGDWCLIVTDQAAKRFDYCAVRPLRGDASNQTVTGDIFLKQAADQQTFCIAFPPGEGFVSIQNVSMTLK